MGHVLVATMTVPGGIAVLGLYFQVDIGGVVTVTQGMPHGLKVDEHVGVHASLEGEGTAVQDRVGLVQDLRFIVVRALAAGAHVIAFYVISIISRVWGGERGSLERGRKGYERLIDESGGRTLLTMSPGSMVTL